MPSLKELFKTKPLPTQNGKVGAEVYDIRNSKDIPINTANGILNATVFPIVQKTLRSSGLLTARTKENLVESELVGLRAIRGLASPVIYGTSLIRFKRKTTNTVEIMKNSTSGGTEVSNFILGSTVAKLQDKALEIASKIGIQFPENLIPTKISENLTFANKKVRDTDKVLKELKDGSAGTLLGRFLAESAQGTPNQIGRQVIGGGITLAKDLVRKKLTSSFTLPNSPTVEDLSPIVEQTLQNRLPISNFYDNGNDRYTKNADKTNISYAGLSGILTGVQDKRVSYIKWVAQQNIDDSLNYANPIQKQVPDFSLDSITQNIPEKRTKPVYSKDSRIAENRLDGKLGIRNGSDILNQSPTWYSEDGTPPTENDKTLDDYDLIPFRFWSIAKKTGVSFRASITGLSETISPSWGSTKFIGNPYNFYTYEGVERSLSLNFKLYALNGDELKRMWEKISFLNTFAYPQQYANPYVTAPFIKFTLGNMYKNKEGFVENLSFTIDDNTNWETGIPHIDKNGVQLDDTTLAEYKLPTIIEVQMTIKFVESQSTYWAGVNQPKRVYYYGGVAREASTTSEIGGNMKPDGSANNLVTTLPQTTVTTTKLPFDSVNTDIINNARKELITNPNIQNPALLSGIKIPKSIQDAESKKNRLNPIRNIFKK
jgi:hypothetical protein